MSRVNVTPEMLQAAHDGTTNNKRAEGDAVEAINAGWLENAETLLNEAEPGATPFVVDEILVSGAIGTLLGKYKAGKSFLALLTGICVATGRSVLDRFEVPEPGPVMVILEESGRRALHRRLSMLARGYGIKASELSNLHFAANQRVRLDDPEWRDRITEKAKELGAVLIIFDPLVRLKGASVDENSQMEMAPVLDFMRDLRDETGSAVLFVHHPGHSDQGRMRGSSDLEGYWESKITVKKDSDGVNTVSAEHREAEETSELAYRLTYDDLTDSIRLTPLDDPPRSEIELEKVRKYVEDHPGSTAKEVVKGVGGRAESGRPRVKKLLRAGTLALRESQRTDRNGRPYPVKGLFLSTDADYTGVPLSESDGTPANDGSLDESGSPGVPPLKGGPRLSGSPDRTENESNSNVNNETDPEDGQV